MSFSQDAGNNLVQPTINISIQELQKYRKRFQKLYSEINAIDNNNKSLLNQLQMISNTDRRLSQMSSRDLAKELLKTKNREAKDNILFSQTSEILMQLESKYKEAYEIVNTFRAIFFTPITYSYGFVHNGQTYSVSGLTFKEISSLISLQLESRTAELDKVYKLRFTPTKAALADFMAANNSRLVKLTATNEKGSTLWSTLDRYRQKYSKGSAYHVNRGQMYEVYRSIIAEKGVDNGPPAPTFEEEYILEKFIDIRKNNLSWTRGGDVEDEQDKFMRASVTSSASLLQILQSLINLLDEKNLNRQEIANNIATVFGNQNFDANVLDESRKFALKNLQDEIFAKLSLTK